MSEFLVAILHSYGGPDGRIYSPKHPGDANLGWIYYGTTREPAGADDALGVLVSGVDVEQAKRAGFIFRSLTPDELASMPDRTRMASVKAGDVVTWAEPLPRDSKHSAKCIAAWEVEFGPAPYRVRHVAPFHKGMPQVYLDKLGGLVASWFRIVDNGVVT